MLGFGRFDIWPLQVAPSPNPRHLARAEDLGMRLMMVVVALAIAAPVVAVEDVDGTFAKLPSDFQSAIVKSLDLLLSDGPSSRIRDVRVPNPQYDPTGVCFFINAKNKFGAYTGYQSAVADLKTNEVFLFRDMQKDDARDRMRHAHYRLCT